MTWLPNRLGRAIDLVHPVPEQVDFDTLAWALAHTNRYNGHGDRPVSVALHTLIGLHVTPEPLRPWWLLHDAPEERTGDLVRPALSALLAIAEEISGARAAGIVAKVWGEFGRRHEAVIHEAAGLALPTDEQRQRMHAIDEVCLATEHRDFHLASARAWDHEMRGVQPMSKIQRFMPPDKAADALAAEFRRYLPRFVGPITFPGEPAAFRTSRRRKA